MNLNQYLLQRYQFGFTKYCLKLQDKSSFGKNQPDIYIYHYD